MDIKKNLFTVCLLLIGSSVFAQSKDLAKMYDELESLENRILELKIENDEAVLSCISSKNWRHGACRDAVTRLSGDEAFFESAKYTQQICECMVGKKHEIEAVETKIKQLERRIELLKSDSKPAQNEKK
ncbi:MAG: hypothetical protein LBK94_06990 [Prevotellaceae bacterium]|nr:hypothetical protein [Prevotellaceae bacterium]